MVSDSELENYYRTLPRDHATKLILINELVKNNIADFVFLKHDSIREFWEYHINRMDKNTILKTALSKLTDIEKEALGIADDHYDIQ